MSKVPFSKLSIRKGRRGPSKQNPDVTKFAQACRNPFDDHSFGCRVPDEFSQPTVAVHCRFSATLTSAATTSSFIIMPSPVLSLIAGDAGSTVSWGGSGAFAGTTNAYRGTPLGQLQNNVADFRVVAWGVRIRNLQPPGTATGMIEIAQVPCTRHVPGETMLESVAIARSNLVQLCVSMANNTGALPTLLGLPESDEYAVQELMANDILAVGKTCSPDWKRLRTTYVNDSINATQTMVNEGVYYTDATGVIVNSGGFSDTTDGTGRTAILIRTRGFPATGPHLDVEIIYHLEGTPSPAANVYVQTGSGALSVVAPQAVEAIQAEQNAKPSSWIIPAFIAHARKGVSNILSGAGDAVSARLGMGAATESRSITRNVARGGANLLLNLLQNIPAVKLAAAVGGMAVGVRNAKKAKKQRRIRG